MEFTLLGGVLVAVVFLYGGLWLMGRNDSSVCVRDVWDLALTAVFAGLVVGRIVAMVRGGVNPISFDFMLFRAGVDTVGATLGAIGMALYMTRGHWPGLLDQLGPAALMGLSGWHAGCLVRGNCLGTPSELPWAWAIEASSITRHPVELYAALALAVAALVAFRFRNRPWLGASLALAFAGLIRLAVFGMQTTLGSAIVWWYLAAAVLGAGFAFLYCPSLVGVAELVDALG